MHGRTIRGVQSWVRPQAAKVRRLADKVIGSSFPAGTGRREGGDACAARSRYQTRTPRSGLVPVPGALVQSCASACSSGPSQDADVRGTDGE